MNTKRCTTRMGLVAIAASSALVLGACGGGGGGNAPEGHQAAPPPQSAPGNSGGAAAGTSCVSSNQVLSNAQSYTGKPVTWEQALHSKEETMPAQLSWNMSLPVSPVPVPGKTRLA